MLMCGWQAAVLEHWLWAVVTAWPQALTRHVVNGVVACAAPVTVTVLFSSVGQWVNVNGHVLVTVCPAGTLTGLPMQVAKLAGRPAGSVTVTAKSTALGLVRSNM